MFLTFSAQQLQNNAMHRFGNNYLVERRLLACYYLNVLELTMTFLLGMCIERVQNTEVDGNGPAEVVPWKSIFFSFISKPPFGFIFISMVSNSSEQECN